MRNITPAMSRIILAVLIVAYIILFSFLSINRYLAFDSHYYDLGIMNQTVYNTSQGRFLEMTNQDFYKNISRLAIHFDPILAIFAPFYKLYSGPEVLLIGQTVFVALGSVAVYLISQKVLKNQIYSLLFAASYLLFYPVQRANLFDFHAVTLGGTFLLFALYFQLIKKHLISFLFIILALLTKEHVGLITFFYGVYLYLFKKEKKFALLVCSVSMVFFIATVFFIIPYYRQGTHFALKYFDDFGVMNIFRLENIHYLARLLSGHIVLILFAPFEFLIALPDIMINLVSSNGNMKQIYFHYNAIIVPFIFYAAIYGLRNLNKLRIKDLYKRLIIIVFLVLNFWNIYQYSALPIPHLQKRAYWPPAINSDKLKVIEKWQRRLDSETVAVATTSRMAPFFSARRHYYDFLFDPSYPTYGISTEQILARRGSYERADYVVVDRDDFHLDDWDFPDKFYEHLLNNPSFVKIHDEAAIEVYKKR